MRSDDVQQYRPIRSALRRLIKAPTVFAILWPMLLVVGGYIGWHRWGSEQIIARFDGVDAARITVTDQPEYVRTSIVQAVYRDTAMDGLSLLDRQATAKIASAFSMHPWVRNVIGVRKLPGGAIDVRLEYRRPVAMVHVIYYDVSKQDGNLHPLNGFLPVDGDGVLLPDKEFTRSETLDYIHIEIPNTDSTNAFVGSPFGGSTVRYAAILAEILMPYREQAGIRSIGVFGDPRQTELPQFEIIKQDGTKFTWGSPPGSELPGERTANMKLRSLIDGNQQGADLRMAAPSRQTPGIGTR